LHAGVRSSEHDTAPRLYYTSELIAAPTIPL
jgi:hypothetical protein